MFLTYLSLVFMSLLWNNRLNGTKYKKCQFNFEPVYVVGTELTHSGPMTSYGKMNPNQHWLGLWLVDRLYQGMTWTNDDSDTCVICQQGGISTGTYSYVTVVIIGSGNGLAPAQRQAMTSSNDNSLSTGPFRTILINILLAAIRSHIRQQSLILIFH